MTFGELIAQMIGWLGDFIEWVISWVPKYDIVQWNERGVRYVRGKLPTEVKPGVCWFWPWCTNIETHHVNRCVLQVASTSLETSDGKAVQVGMVVTYHIVDVCKYEVENFEAEEAMAEVAQAGLRNIVMELPWEKLTACAPEDSRLEKMLTSRMQSTLGRFGVEVESARPTDQVRLNLALRSFGGAPVIVVPSSEE